MSQILFSTRTIDPFEMFDKLLDKATSHLLLECDWETILRICDAVKSLEVTPRHAVQSIKKKLRHDNPHVILRALQCLESMVKNCGAAVHKEVAQNDVMEVLKHSLKNNPEQIRSKVLELIQCWSSSLGRQYQIFSDTYHLLKHEQYRFPPLKPSEVMVESEDVPPEWKDAKQCFRCRQTFTTFTRKHHCRACGQIFCEKCSSKYCLLPKLGFDRYVRVCEACYEKLPTKKVSSKSKRATKSQAKTNEDDSLQLALAISRREADEKERQKKNLTLKYATTDTSEENLEHPSINEKEIDQFTTILTEHLQNFKLRMLSDQQRQRTITTDTAVQSIFLTLQYSYPELARWMQFLEDKQNHYENLQDKLNQLKDAREALDALRKEHFDQKQQQASERERQRHIQLALKLDLMRQKKQDYLEYQRQLILAHEQCLQNSHTPTMGYPTNINPQFSCTYPINVNGNPVYLNSVDQVPLVDPYSQQSISIINGNGLEA